MSMAQIAEMPESLVGATARARSEVSYPNFWSKMLFHKMFQRQYIIPEEPSWLFEKTNQAIENIILRPDISQIDIVKPIFLIGLPRSGTTLTSDLVCSHPDLGYITNSMHSFRTCFCAVEVIRKLFNLDVRGGRYLADTVEVSAGSPSDSVCFWGEWLKYGIYDYEFVDRKLADYSQADLDFMYTQIKKILWCFGGKGKRFCTKNPMLIPDVPVLAEMFPDGKFVHILRDPRKCANSMLKIYWLEKEQLEFIQSQKPHTICTQGSTIPYPRVRHMKEWLAEFGPADIRTTAHIWQESVDFIQERRNQLPNLYEIRFEDLLADPVQEMAKIFEFCELPPIEKDNKKYWTRIGEVGTVRHKNEYGDFSVIEQICADGIKRYGY
jgi:hypothetical protein